MTRPIRLAARALILLEGKLLLVNAYPGYPHRLWCAPGGGAEPGAGLAETVAREVQEETGLTIRATALAGVSEFHAPDDGFHQVDLFFHAEVLEGRLDPDWRDPAGVVTEIRLVDRDALAALPHKPNHLAAMAFDRVLADYHGIELKV